jgi:hypothetical protein
MQRPLDVSRPYRRSRCATRPGVSVRGLCAGLVFAAATLLLLQAPGCTSSSTTSPDGGSPPQTVCLPLDAGLPVVTAFQGVDGGPDGEPLEQFLDDYYAAYCDAESRCAPFASYLIATCVEQLQATGTWNAYPQCRQIPEGIECESQGYDLTVVAQQVRAAELGEALSYDAHAGAACVAAPWGCVYGGPYILFPPACSGAFVGLVPDGGVCDFSSECQDGNCVPANGGSCSGMCEPPTTPPPNPVAQPGSFCGFGVGCGTDGGLACDSDYLQCRGTAGVGETCDDFGFYRCAKGLYCDDSQTCQLQATLGETCLYPLDDFAFLGPDLFRLCATGLVCQGEAVLSDGGLRAGSCLPLSQLGQACADLGTDDVQHLSGCTPGTACSCGICVPPPSSGKCADEVTPCRPYVAACDYLDGGTCQPVSSFARCSNGQQCATGYCSPDLGQCTTVPPNPVCSD